MRAWRILGVIAVLTVSGATAAGQRLIVRTTAYSAAREPVRATLHCVDFALEAAVPAPEPLPGIEPAGRLLLSDAGDGLVAGSRGLWPQRERDHDRALSFISGFGAAPFMPGADGLLIGASGWREQPGCLAYTPDHHRPLVVALAGRVDRDGIRRGLLRILETGPGPGISFPTGPTAWALPGYPVAAALLDDTALVAVLCRPPYGPGSLLHIRDVVTGRVYHKAVELSPEDPLGGFGSDPVAVAVTPDGSRLLALTYGYGTHRPDGEAVSWLHVLDTESFGAAMLPLELPGTPADEPHALHVAADGSCWVATRAPASGFAYALRRGYREDAPRDVTQPFTGVTHPLRIATAPDGPHTAVAVEERLELWPDGEPSGLPHRYEHAIGALHWTAEGLFVGEGNRVHLVDPESGAPVATVALDSGLVSEIVLAPAETLPAPDPDADGVPTPVELQWGTAPHSADTDGDGIPDGWDPEPTRPSPRLRVPPVVTFRGEAAGKEWRVVPLHVPHAENSRWRLSFDQARLPWLRAYPRSGTVGSDAFFQMGVDPAQYDPTAEIVEGAVTVHMTGAHPGFEAAGSPARIHIRVVQDQSDVRRILWVLGAAPGADSLRAPGDPYGLRALAELLASPPHGFSHREASGPFLEALSPHRIVVLGAAAAARGAVTRQALLDYVAQGGALLFLGGHLEGEESRSIMQWLSPTGLHLTPGNAVSGRFPAARRDGLCLHWDSFAIENGCEMQAEVPSTVLVKGASAPGQAVFFATGYGLGRIAALAAPTPIESPALAAESNRLFAADLFRWLAGAGQDIADADADGVPDVIEDRNRNSRVDPGETDPFNPDSDGDGIPDGAEDRNRNGLVDEGETSPLNADSDGDGIPDGADPDPLPRLDAPHVARVEPDECPAQGGADVLITGRNFEPGSAVWFGARRAPRVRVLGATALIAEAPAAEQAEGGLVEIRVVNGSSGLAGALPQGFRYGARSAVRLRLEQMLMSSGRDGYASVHLDSPSGAEVGRLTLLLSSDPERAVRWKQVTPGATAAYSRRQLQSRPAPTGGLWLDVSPPARATRSGELAVVTYALAEEEDSGMQTTPRLLIERARAAAPNGEPLDVVIEFDDAPD